VNLDDNQKCDQVVPALRDSGFLVVKSSLLPLELQQKALAASARILESSSKTVTHPSDPKHYAMLDFDNLGEDLSEVSEDVSIIREYYRSLRKIRDILLQSIASGLGMDDSEFFSRLHNENNDSIRLLNYLRGNENTANRCKAHSDYGTLTLLLTDGVGGLEAFVDDQWRQVPYVEGCLIVNIGSILSEWTRQDLKATLHRVAGPASVGSTTSKNDLLKAVQVERRSIAYFADPNPNVATTLSQSNNTSLGNEDNMTIDEYIQWRSGGTGTDRAGVSFTRKEEERLG
jgi:isopenicillin N synthase-like dioxygenase